MATTSPDNIWSPDSGDDYALTVDLAAMADTVQDAITNVRTTGSYRAGLESGRVSTPSPFSGLLYFSTDTGRLWRYNGTTWLPQTSGLVLIQTLTFSAASTVVFTGFTSQFDNYLAKFDMNSSGTAGGTVRMRSGGTDNATANYSAQQQFDRGTTHTAVMQSALTSLPLVPVAGAEITSDIDFSGPNLARVTRMAVSSDIWVAPNDGTKATVSGRFNAATVFDGFSFTPSAGTVTGTLSVYGYAK